MKTLDLKNKIKGFTKGIGFSFVPNRNATIIFDDLHFCITDINGLQKFGTIDKDKTQDFIFQTLNK